MLALLPIRLALAPITLTQALASWRRLTRLPPVPGARQGVVGSGPALRLFILGDGAAAGLGAPSLEQSFAGYLVADLARDFTVHWRVEARPLATSAQALRHLRALDLGRIDVAVTALGIADIRRQVSPRRFRNQQRAIAQLMLDRGARQIWRTGLPPVERLPHLPQPWRMMLAIHARALDKVLEQDTHPPIYRLPYDQALLRPDLRTSDRLVPSTAAYAEWARRQAREIRLRV
ncbi:GDSL-type esterase/lipase family protein [Pararhodobacter marinus]|uniref:GDSL-type esterase/lipase family protein n=1 Tax=Pararhodobacter marinus TaxID=2184063 RepID=UPI0035121528